MTAPLRRLLTAVTGAKSGADGEPDKAEKRPPWSVITVLLLLASLMIVAHGALAASRTLLIVELLLATAALVVGGFLGFLFGIPRASTGAVVTVAGDGGVSKETSGNTAGSGYEPSTNLEQVADWLTKILIGVGLVEFGDIADTLARFGAAMAGTFPEPAVGLIGQLILIAFLVLGFIASFLWTRIYYGAIQTLADGDVRSLLARMTVTERRSKAAEEVSTALATGELKPATPARAASAVAPEVREADPIAALPSDLRARVDRLRDWPEFDWDSDPNADLFTGAPREANGRRLDAEILANLKNKALHLKLRVSRMPGGDALEGPVLFLLHPTYSKRVELAWPQTDVADLQIISEGAFTVVAIADGGATVLSWNLMSMPNAPQWFREQ